MASIRAARTATSLMYRQSIQFPAQGRRAARGRARARRSHRRDAARSGRRRVLRTGRGRPARRHRAGAKAARPRTPSCRRARAGRSPAAATDLTRAFSIWFQAVNTAEKVHRVRRRRQYLSDSSTVAARRHRGLHRAPAARGHARWTKTLDADRLDEHRAGVHRASDRIDAPHHPAQAAAHRAGPARPAQSRRSPRRRLDTLWARVRLEITTIWQTEEHPREKTHRGRRARARAVLPDRHPVSRRAAVLRGNRGGSGAGLRGPRGIARMCPASCVSARGSAATWTAMPTCTARPFARRCTAISSSSSPPISTECGSWRRPSARARTASASARHWHERIDAYTALLPGAQALAPARHDRMPYRMFFGQIGERLKATYDGRPNAYQNSEELLADVRLAADSLTENRGRHGGLFSGAPLHPPGTHLRVPPRDAGRHPARPRARRGDRHRASGCPQWPRSPPRSGCANCANCWRAIRARRRPLDAGGGARCGCSRRCPCAAQIRRPRSIGDYIVSGAQGPEDVLAVLLLARWADITDKRTGECPLDVAPLLESIGVARAGRARCCASCTTSPPTGGIWRRARNRQMVVIGYSDTNKQGGIAASRWALQVAQIAADRGGARSRHHASRSFTARRHAGARRRPHRAPGRGGAARGHARRAASDRAGRGRESELRAAADRHAHPRAHIRGRGTRDGARRPAAPVPPDAARRDAHHRRRRASRRIAGWCSAMRGFFEFFRAATPLDVIERMHIGSRPAMRAGGGGDRRALRPIPWVFAWTQSRHMLPGWYGFGSGLRGRRRGARGSRARRHAGCSWPFFGHLLDDVEAMLARTDLEIAAHYDALAGRRLASAWRSRSRRNTI